ncbi:ATP-dependent zinc metalloprotease FtsH, partial [Bradyrhizobium sp.]|uniref:ATP-dependent zinc metalloprotease FtsH n=1 Tax=Bradyrhizobium sp. TaxID=376 RepID=UPI00391C63F6
MTKQTRFNLWYAIIAIFVAMMIHNAWTSYRQVAVIPYSQFQDLLAAGKVKEVGVSENYLEGTLKEPLPSGQTRFATTRVDQEFAKELAKANVTFTGRVESNILGDILSLVMPIALFFGVWYWLSRRMMGGAGGLGGGLMQIGKSKAKVYVEANTGVRFEDVAGVDEAKDELREIVAFLKDPKSYGRLGGRMPKGVLLVGPPGTGKTLLAKAVAGEAGVPFFSISGSEFVEMFVGVGAARVRDLFEQARAKAPAIIFIDELDALGRARGMGPFAGGHDEKEQTLNQLLVELDGFDSSVGLVLLAATNRPEILDPALLRAGRFDRQVLVDRPDRPGRLAILRVHARKIVLAADTDLDQMAGITVGLAGADLANVVNEAALAATRLGAPSVTLEHFTLAIERIVAGIEKRRGLLSQAERRLVACHELGHALVALSLPGADRVHKVSIIPRGIGALGYTLQRPSEDRHVQRKGELLDRLTILMAGRAAELVVFGEASTGAADDLVKATDLARDMVLRYGMDETLGPVSWAGDRPLFLPQGVPASAQVGTAAATAQRA